VWWGLGEKSPRLPDYDLFFHFYVKYIVTAEITVQREAMNDNGKTPSFGIFPS
jgi:hypothetical protein